MKNFPSYTPGQILTKFDLKGEELIIKVPEERDIVDIRELLSKIARDFYIADRYDYPSIDSMRDRYNRVIKLAKKGKDVYFIGQIKGKTILTTNYSIKKIMTGKYKGKISMEIGISIDKDYQKKGIGGKILDFFIEMARGVGIKIIIGRFFHENFDSLVLCKSRGLNVYKIEKNKPPCNKKWKKDFHKWGRCYDRVNSRLFIE